MIKAASVLVLLGSCLVLVSCSLKKTAENAAKTTEEMNEKMKDLKETSQNLKERTDALESEMTFDLSHTRMIEHLDRLFAETSRDNVGVVTSLWQLFFGHNEDPDLFAEAAFTMHAMYFQFWKGQSGEDLAELDARLEIGTELLFDRLFKHIPRDAQVDVLRPNLSYKGVAAIGAKLDEVHARYLLGLKRRDLPRMTLYDYILQALRNRDALARGEHTPRAAAKILQWEHEAVYTLQLRHNILPVMVLARTTDFQDRKDLRRFWMWWKGQKIDLSKANPEQLKEWTTWLKKASQTRKDLREIGIRPEYNRKLAELFEGVDFGQAEIMRKTDPSAQEMLLRDFAVAFTKNVAESKADAEPMPVRKADPMDMIAPSPF